MHPAFGIHMASCKRVTGETDISMELNLDGTGCAAVATGHAFFDHMLDLLARHSLMDLTLQARGDLRWTTTTRWRT